MSRDRPLRCARDRGVSAVSRRYLAQGKTAEEAGELALLHAFLASGGDGEGAISLDEWVGGMSAIGEKTADAEFAREMGDTVRALAQTVTLRSLSASNTSLRAAVDK